jgi:hypothetical protein
VLGVWVVPNQTTVLLGFEFKGAKVQIEEIFGGFGLTLAKLSMQG